MSDKMVTIKGKQISEDTAAEALKAYCGFSDFDEERAPVFSYIDNRLFIKMNKNIRKYFAEFASDAEDGDYWSFEQDGFIGARALGNTWKEASSFYSGDIPKSLFPKRFPDPKR